MVTSNFPELAQEPAPVYEAGREARLKILLVDDHHLVREGLKLSLLQIDRKACVIEADNVPQAIETYRQQPDIDLVLLDLGLPGLSGMESLAALYASCPDARVVVVSAKHDLRTVRAALEMGVSGFIPKMSGASATLNALRFVLNGDVYVPPEVFLDHDIQEAPRPAFQKAPEPAPQPHLQPHLQPQQGSQPAPAFQTPREAGLTARQIDVMRLLLEGRSNKQICVELGLALGTVKSHVAAILQLLGAGTRIQAVVAVENRGWREAIMREGRPGTP